VKGLVVVLHVELTFTNRSAAEAEVELVYTAASGVDRDGRDRIGPRRRRLSATQSPTCARSDSPSRGVDVAGRFGRLFRGSRLPPTPPSWPDDESVPDGRAGLAYPASLPALRAGVGLRPQAGCEGPLESRPHQPRRPGRGRDPAGHGLPDEPLPGFPKTLPVVTLPPAGSSNSASPWSRRIRSRLVTVDRQSGTVPYYAYGVIKRPGQLDGSSSSPFWTAQRSGKRPSSSRSSWSRPFTASLS